MPAFLIEARPDLRRHLFRLLGLDPRDRNLPEYDSEIQESIHYFIQQGLWNAQLCLITSGRAPFWRSRALLEGWTEDAVTEAKYVTLPEDFLRLDGDYYRSALFDASTKRPWGKLVATADGELARGDCYWVSNDRLYTARGARLPTSLYANYFYRHPILETDETALDFPLEIRPLIPAEAAVVALKEAWLPLDDGATRSRIDENHRYWRVKAEEMVRPTREPARMDPRGQKLSTTFFGV